MEVRRGSASTRYSLPATRYWEVDVGGAGVGFEGEEAAFAAGVAVFGFVVDEEVVAFEGGEGDPGEAEGLAGEGVDDEVFHSDDADVVGAAEECGVSGLTVGVAEEEGELGGLGDADFAAFAGVLETLPAWEDEADAALVFDEEVGEGAVDLRGVVTADKLKERLAEGRFKGLQKLL